MMDSCRVRPDISKNSSTLSKPPESEKFGSTIGNRSLILSPKRSLAATPSRALIQFLLPRRVLISPLWLMKRLGCARSQEGKVLVEKRECTIAKWLS